MKGKTNIAVSRVIALGIVSIVYISTIVLLNKGISQIRYKRIKSKKPIVIDTTAKIRPCVQKDSV